MYYSGNVLLLPIITSLPRDDTSFLGPRSLEYLCVCVETRSLPLEQLGWIK
jgi:hypothetical protein